MKTFWWKSLLIATTILLVVSGCNRRHTPAPGTVQTQTIAPATAPDQTDANGTDAMTHTVDVEDGRSEDEGGVLTDTAAKTDTATAARKKTGAAAASRPTPRSNSRPAGRTQ